MADFCSARELPSSIMNRFGNSRTLVVVYHISKMVSSTVMGFPHTHGVVGEVHIAVVALKW